MWLFTSICVVECEEGKKMEIYFQFWINLYQLTSQPTRIRFVQLHVKRKELFIILHAICSVRRTNAGFHRFEESDKTKKWVNNEWHVKWCCKNFCMVFSEYNANSEREEDESFSNDNFMCTMVPGNPFHIYLSDEKSFLATGNTKEKQSNCVVNDS